MQSPERPTPERMDIRSKPGTVVIFDGLGGYEHERIAAADVLTFGRSYTVQAIEVGDFSSRVILVGHKQRFNTVLFAGTTSEAVQPQGAGHDGKDVSALTSQAQPVEAEPGRPDLLEKLEYHRYERDDLTLDDCLDHLASGWKKIHGRTERQMVMQILALLAAHPSSAEPEGKESAQPMQSDRRDEFEELVLEWNEPMDRLTGNTYVSAKIQDAWWVWRWAMDAARATQHEAAPKVEPVAWMDPVSHKIITEAYRALLMKHPGKIAQGCSVPLYTTPHNLDGLLREMASWLHAAYDRPPQSPECVAMLAKVGAALRQQVGGAG